MNNITMRANLNEDIEKGEGEGGQAGQWGTCRDVQQVAG